MKLGLFLALFGDKDLDDAFSLISKAGLQAVEIGTWNQRHLDMDALLASDEAVKQYLDRVASYGLSISALSCHGNPVHPDAAAAKHSDEHFRKTVLVAEKLGVDTVITFSGCPGESEHSRYPS